MKRNTFKKKPIDGIKLVALFFLFLNTEFVKAQVFQNNVLYVSNNTVFYMDTPVGNYQFGTATGVTSSSTRTTNIYGRLAFAEGVVSTAATSNHFFDGYITTYSTNDFTFPVGQTVFAPIKVNASSTAGVDAAYLNSNPTTLGSSFSAPIVGLSSTGYWNVQRTTGSNANAKITLIWSSSLASLIGTDLNALIISGYNGTDWVEILSDAAVGDVNSGEISSSGDVDLSVFKYFTFAKKETCAPVIADNGVTTVWNGISWSNDVPTAQTIAVLNANYSGNIVANSLNMGAFNVALADGEVMEIVKGVSSTTGKVLMSSNATIVQRDDVATPPKIELIKNTRTLPRYNYTYFGSPVQENIFSQLAGAYYQNPSSNNRLYNHYKWTAGNDVLFQTPYVSAWTSLNIGNFVTPGYGWISSVSSLSPFNTDTFSGIISLKISGTANNGVLTKNVYKSSNPDADHGSNYNLLANPYPSAINADKFIDENLDIDGSIYIWEAKTQPSLIETGTYSQSDYITYTKAGFTAPSVGTSSFNGKIATAQGFMVKANSTGVVTFNNCMRLSGSTDNNNFFRSNNELSNTPVDRYKLNLISSTQHFNQVLIAYIPGLTVGYDRGYDAARNSTSSSQLFTIMDNSNRRLAIDARPSFINTDVVSVGFSSSSPLNTTSFQISVVDKEGVFLNNDVNIFIYDKLNNIYHNLNNSPFNFTASQSELLDRFQIVYQDGTLSNPDFDNSTVFVNLNNNTLFLSSSTKVIKSAQVYDVTGRLIQKVDINGINYSGVFNHAQALYIVRIEFTDGSFVSNKVINK